jgi:hypothetical protein
VFVVSKINGEEEEENEIEKKKKVQIRQRESEWSVTREAAAAAAACESESYIRSIPSIFMLPFFHVFPYYSEFTRIRCMHPVMLALPFILPFVTQQQGTAQQTMHAGSRMQD